MTQGNHWCYCDDIEFSGESTRSPNPYCEACQKLQPAQVPSSPLAMVKEEPPEITEDRETTGCLPSP